MINLSAASHHPAMEEIVQALCNKTQNADTSFFKAQVAYFLGMMASNMRAKLITQDRGELPVNIYSVCVATSGYGKGYSVGLMEDQVIKPFRSRFMDQTFPLMAEKNLNNIANRRAAINGTDQQTELTGAEKEFARIGPFLFAFDSGTAPAVKQLRHKLLLSGAGSINLQIDEIGSNLMSNVEVLNLYLELYDQGITKQKLVKNTPDNQRGEDLMGKTPANMLLFGSPDKLFDGSQTEDQFFSFLEIGYARRCIFGVGRRDRKSYHKKTPEEIFADLTKSQNNSDLQKWAKHFHQLADPKMFGWEMEVPYAVGEELMRYKVACEKEADKLPDHQTTQKAELEHRYFKALKLAGAYTFIDQSVEVMMDHLHAAIKLIEESGEAFQSIVNQEKPYEKLAKFIAQSDEELTHADLHSQLPFYKSGQAARNEMMTLATAWGYKQHIVIKKSFVDGIEFFSGETLEETSLDDMMLSYSDHWAYHYGVEDGPDGQPMKLSFDKLHVLTQADGMHWANHKFKGGHRAEDNVLPGFNLIVVDVDGGVGLDAVHELLKDYKFLTYTTKRHTEEENRFRLIMPTNYILELDQEDYKEFMRSFLAWLPFNSDEAALQRSKKWETYSGGKYHYNMDGDLLDVLKFVPKTSRNEAHKKEVQELGSLDNLERWFAQRIASGNRNNLMIKFALALVDSGLDITAVGDAVHSFNKKLNDSLSREEIENTIMVTVAKRFQKKEAAS